MRRTFALTPVDAWFFGGGQPYTRESSDQTNVRSLFPPNAPTVVGAIRAAAARAMGWDGCSPWDDEVVDRLGDGLDLGPLTFGGPMLLRRTGDDEEAYAGEWQRLYPAPLHLLGSNEHDDDTDNWNPATLLRPGDEAVPTDAGEMRPPVRTNDINGVSEPDGVWVTRSGLESILHAEIPAKEECLNESTLWEHEPRVGLERDNETRRVEEGKLYSPSYVRLAPDVAVGTSVDGLPDVEFPDRLMFGGESRMANLEATDSLEFPAAPTGGVEKSGRMSVTFVTPCRLDSDTFDELRPGVTLGSEFGPLEDYRVVSACIGKPTWIGGWHPSEQRPLPLRPHVPAGSTLFVEPNDGADVVTAGEVHGATIGAQTDYGFGEVVVGTWKEE
jgi:CRISPR-associated protein Cmr3